MKDTNLFSSSSTDKKFDRDSNLFRQPDPNDRHARDDGIGVLLGSRVDGVVGTDDEGEVDVVDLRVDFVHLVHDVVRHSGFGQQNVQLSWHSAYKLK